jgi:hypothetical protein
MNQKGFGRKRSCLIEALPRHFSGGPKEYHKKNSVRIASIEAEVQTENLQNTSVERYRYVNILGFQKFVRRLAERTVLRHHEFCGVTSLRPVPIHDKIDWVFPTLHPRPLGH